MLRYLRFLRSSAFLLTLRYMLLFGGSVAALLVFIYSATIGEMERQVQYSVNIQLADLGRKFVLSGPLETSRAIEHFLEKNTDDSSIYLLLTPRWRILAGNVSQWPGGIANARDWVRLTLDEENNPDGPHGRFLAINSTLPGGYVLLVGQNLKSIEKVEQIIEQVFWLCLGLTLFAGALGGLLLTRIIARRLEQVNRLCRRVMDGALDERAAVTGGGDEFDHLAGNVNRMLDRIRELIEGIRDISASVAHDLRTPLNRLRQRLEQLEAHPVSPEKTREELRLAMTEIDTLVSTFNAILRIAEAESKAGIGRFEPFDLTDVMQGLSDLYGALAEEKNIIFESDIAADITCQGDRHLLIQAIANLLDNAVKYTPASGRVEVSLMRADRMIRITVADNGPGIPPEFYTKVTEKFFRMEASRSTQGNGLGLSLSRAAVEMHGGSLTFYNNEPGLKVEITLDDAQP